MTQLISYEEALEIVKREQGSKRHEVEERTCWCGKKCIEVRGKNNTSFVKCGATVDVIEGEYGCNLFSTPADLKAMKCELVEKFGSIHLYVFERDCPKCTFHKCFCKLKKLSDGRCAFVCDVKAPNQSCGYFEYLIPSEEDLARARKRKNRDVEYLEAATKKLKQEIERLQQKDDE